MAFEIPTLDDEHEFLIALFRNLFQGLHGTTPDVSRGSFNWLWLRTLAGGVTDNHAHIFSLKSDLLPDEAVDELLDRWGNIRGVPRKGATPARKSTALRISGAALTAVAVGEQLSFTSGIAYQVTRADIVGPGGYVDVDVAALSSGSATRLDTGSHLTFLNTPVGLNEDAILQKDLDEGGEDREDNGAYRLRILNRFQQPALGGAQNDYVQWALEVTDVGAAFCYRRRAGVGTVDVAALHKGSGGDRLLTLPEIAIVQAYIDSKRPVSVKDARVIEVTSRLVDVDYTVITDGAIEHAFDWDDSAPGVALLWTALTRTLQFTTGARPSTLKAGDRITIKPAAGGGTGAQRVVESFGAGADEVVLEAEDGAIDPAPTDTIYAGGKLVDAVRAAITALFDSLGPANPDATRYGAWEGNVRPGAISRVASGVAGVLDGTVVAPGATVQAVDPAGTLDDSTIELLVPGRILVRAAH